MTQSRVGIVGPNGAGKSTLIKLLTVRLLQMIYVPDVIRILTVLPGRDGASAGHSL